MITLLNLGGFLPSCISNPSFSSSSNKLFYPTSSSIDTFNNSTYSFLISFNYKCFLNYSHSKLIRATDSSSNSAAETPFDHDGGLSNRVSVCKDSNEALELIAELTKTSSGVVSVQDCCSIISAALDCDNADLALSVFSAMRSTFDQDIGDKGLSVERWKWSRPDVNTYTLLVCGLAASLRVSDALRVIANVCR
ncbi:Pentatricopeptide repeat-containing protein [Heracleum sosnowskyi]|uniref:Pentatricopeptide repeat-containing protein n=1 Tax=Heracleum sosnowskyi TaxID=360622 RepID=A0AAD8JBM1_9APIA|nr:Pentatricopeptide repeat-containing protein [Heracleum sosnowskyi]